MITGRQYLRARQGEHSLVLLSPVEFDALLGKGDMPLPVRHAEHFARVLRRSEGWNAMIGNGQDRLCEAVIEQGKIRLMPESADSVVTFSRRKGTVTIAQAWIKPKALALVLMKCAELGVDEIVLFDCDHSAPHSEKPQRIDAILENACMQAYNPVKPAVRFADYVPKPETPEIHAFFGDPAATVWLEAGIAASTRSMFICGPEGGFSPAEAAALEGFATGVLISENVLRAETAAIIAAGILCLGK